MFEKVMEFFDSTAGKATVAAIETAGIVTVGVVGILNAKKIKQLDNRVATVEGEINVLQGAAKDSEDTAYEGGAPSETAFADDADEDEEKESTEEQDKKKGGN